VIGDVDRMIAAADLPWVEQGDGVWFKPLRLSPERDMCREHGLEPLDVVY
jgi:hypothetical protein